MISAKVDSTACGKTDREVFGDRTNKAYLTLPSIKSLQSTPLASSSAVDIDIMENSTEECDQQKQQKSGGDDAVAHPAAASGE